MPEPREAAPRRTRLFWEEGSPHTASRSEDDSPEIALPGGSLRDAVCGNWGNRGSLTCWQCRPICGALSFPPRLLII